MNERDDKEENKTTRFSTNFSRFIIQATKDPFLIFLTIIALLILVMFWLSPEYTKHPFLPYIYVAALVVFAVLGMWTHLATVRQERNNLLVERDRLVDALRDARDDLQSCRDAHRLCQESLAKFIATKT